MKGKKAFLGGGWEDIRLKIPSGKYRLVMVDFWDHTAEMLGDFDSLEEAKKYLEEFAEFDDESVDFVIYNSRGEVVYNADCFSPFPAESRVEGKGEIRVPVEEDVTIQIDESANYVVVAIFTNSSGNFEDLLFEEVETLEEVKKAAEELREKHKDASEIIILDKDGNVY
ncbi:MAG: hypothetical protein J7L63_01740 [Thermoplasmata archaeon]|nr:hypothetical protein [Thermoplasmata archaeon]